MSTDAAPSATVERIYALDAGQAMVEDGAIYSPGIDVGVPKKLSCNAYLIKHRDGWMLWDAGIEDALVAFPEGKMIAHGILGILRRTLASQLDEIGVAAGDIGTLVLSHAHFDHVGNCRLFPRAKWVVQKAEYEAMFGSEPAEHGFLPELYDSLRGNPLEVVSGDHDIFGDGSVRLLATPGHTPGHCSLLVRLPQSEPVILSGDVAHFESNFVHRRVPAFNFSAEQSLASMDKVEAVLRAEGARLWINHDMAQNATIPHAPQWIE